jgi:hypothetical protein
LNLYKVHLALPLPIFDAGLIAELMVIDLAPWLDELGHANAQDIGGGSLLLSHAYVLGVGMTKFIKPRGKVDYHELGYEAGIKAMLDAKITLYRFNSGSETL